MSRSLSHLGSRFMFVLLCAAIFCSVVPAQDDEDPNSPQPLLITRDDSASALTSPGPVTSKLGTARKTSVTPTFAPSQEAVLFVTNLDLMKGEGANAFRIYAVDKKGHQYRFPIGSLTELPQDPGVYAVAVKLTDEAGFWNFDPQGNVAV